MKERGHLRIGVFIIRSESSMTETYSMHDCPVLVLVTFFFFFPDTENSVARPNKQPQTMSFPLSEEVFLKPGHGTSTSRSTGSGRACLVEDLEQISTGAMLTHYVCVSEIIIRRYQEVHLDL